MFAFYNIRALFASIVFITVVWADTKEADKPLVDTRTSEYFYLEQDLWTQINSGEHPTTLLENVLQAHRVFFPQDFGVSIHNLAIYEPSGILVDSLRNVNDLFYETSHILLNTETIESIDILHLHTIIQNAKAYSDHVFNEANRPEFWENGKDYTKHCRQLEESSSMITIESEFQLIHNYYKDVRVALLKTYIMTQLSHMLISIHNKATGNDISSEDSSKKKELNDRVNLIRRNVHNLLKIARRDSWVCERFPYIHDDEESEGYVQITRFLQGYIDHELNFNNESTCTNTCEDYTNTKHVRCESKTSCDQNPNTDVAVCSGDIRGCEELDSDDVEICFGDREDHRYHYLKYSDGTQHGKLPMNTNCSSKGYANSWQRWFVKCSSCYCLCDDSIGSDRHFSLRDVVSSVEDNRVITGVRFVKESGVIHLAISQRKLLPHGQTDELEQDTWDSVDDPFAVTDTDVIEDIDYATLTYENRAINLDDLILPQGKVVTGVRFKRNDTTGHLTLEIRATDFDYSTGRLLNITYNPWHKNVDGGQVEIEIPKKRNPLRYIVTDLYTPQLIPNAYVKFGPSDIDYDVGQTTVPFIETNPLESRNPTPLGGIGLTYKSAGDETAGFIALKTFIYDFSIANANENGDYIDWK